MANTPADLTKCDNIFDLTETSPEVLDGQSATDFSISYYETTAEANAGTNPITGADTYTGTDGQTIYVRIENTSNTGCYNVADFSLNITDIEIGTMANLEECDGDNDGFAEFDLSDNQSAALVNGGAAGDLSYYPSQSDVDNETNEITAFTNYTNASNPQTIYVRLDGNDGCFDTGSFEIESTPSGVANTPNDLTECTNVFDLTENDAVVLDGQTGFAISYYADATDADAGTNPITDADDYTGSDGDIIYVRIENTTNTGCYNVADFILSITDVEIGAMANLEECDGDNDGFAEFDLSDNQSAALANGGVATDLSYYTNQNDADNAANAITTFTNYTNASNPQTIYVRLVGDNGCFDTGSFEIESTPSGVANTPNDLSECTNLFDLTENDAVVLGSQSATDFDISYYESTADAAAGTNPITGADDYTGLDGDIIYVRIENISNDTCYNVADFTLHITDVEIGAMANLEECDGDNDGSAEFDLSDNQSAALANGGVATGLSYFTNQNDADNAANAITAFTNYTNAGNPQTIYVRLDGDNGCFDVGSFEIESTPSGVANTPNDLIECTIVFDLTENDDVVLGSQDEATFEISYYADADDAEAGTNEITDVDAATYTGTDGQTIYVRIENTSNTNGCHNVAEFTLHITDIEIGAMANLEECDGDNDGFAEFDLSDNQSAALANGGVAGDLSYYPSQSDVDNETNEITAFTNYTNAGNPQTIYVRLDGNDGCFDVGSFEIKSTPSGVANTPADLTECTNVFDLTENDAVVLGSQSATDFDISYYETTADAAAGTNPITGADTYTGTDGQTIYVRIENTSNTGCYNIADFSLNITDIEIGTMTDLEECDGDNDGSAEFDLSDNQSAALVNGGAAGDLSYFTDPTDADNAANAITTFTNYTNASNPQTIYVRIENVNSGDCYDVAQFDLHTGTVAIGDLDELEQCATGDDGSAIFDLAVNTANALDGEDAADFTVSYYEFQDDADNNTDAIGDPVNFENTSNPQTIYVRIDNGDCYDVSQFDLHAGTVTIGDLDDLEQCATGDAGSAIFDLTANDGNALDGADAADFTVSYYESQDDADNNTDAIADPENFESTSNPLTIYVRLEGNDGCFDVDSFKIKSTLSGVANAPNDLTECDNTFNLTETTPEVLDGQDAATFDISYYENEVDAEAGQNAIANVDQYPGTDDETIYVRIENADNGDCYDVANFDLHMGEVAIGDLDDLEQCATGYAGSAIFDLTVNTANALDGADAADFTVSYYESQADADNDTDVIDDPENYTSTQNPQTIYVRLDGNDDCFDVGSFEIESTPSGVANTPNDLTECNDTFDLTENNTVVLDGQTGFAISYYADATDANAGVNPITDADDYTGSDGDIIYVRIENADNGDCHNVAQFDLHITDVEIGDLDDLEQCATGDVGSAIFDLTANTDNALDGADAADFTVSYYESQDDADNDTGAIDDPENFENTSNPQTI